MIASYQPVVFNNAVSAPISTYWLCGTPLLISPDAFFYRLPDFNRLNNVEHVYHSYLALIFTHVESAVSLVVGIQHRQRSVII